MTNKEREEFKRQLKERDEQNAQLKSQVRQAQRSEEIAKKQLEEAEDKEPEVIEREVIKEVVPDEVKQQLEQFKQNSNVKVTMLTSLETNCNVIEVASAIQIKHMKKKN